MAGLGWGLPASTARRAHRPAGISPDATPLLRVIGPPYIEPRPRTEFSPRLRMLLAKAIADIAFRKQVFGISRVLLHLLSQPAYKDSKVFAFVTPVRTPKKRKQPCVGDRSTGVLHKEMHDVEFPRS